MKRIDFTNRTFPPSGIPLTADILNELQDNIEAAILEGQHDMFHIGDIYITFSSEENPATRFGGTWELTSKGRMLVGVDPDDPDFAEVEKLGGSKHHQHKLPLYTYSPVGAESINRLPWNTQNYGLAPGEPLGGVNPGAYATFTVTGHSGEIYAHPYLSSEELNLFSNVTAYIWKKISDETAPTE